MESGDVGMMVVLEMVERVGLVDWVYEGVNQVSVIVRF